MTTMRQLGILSLIVCLAAASGCNICCWGKRASELGSPTDIRKAHYWCMGEDAVFAQPCGPNREDYGLKATCWREWPADGGRCKPGTCPTDGPCGPVMVPTAPLEMHTPQMWEQPLPSEAPQNLNPFRDDVPTLPAPTGSGASSPEATRQIQQTASDPAQLAPTPRATAQRTKPAAEPPAMVPPQDLPQRPTAPRHVDASTPVRRTATTPEIHAPTRHLAPVKAPRISAMPKVTNAQRPIVEAQTLAGLDRMIESPTQRSPAVSGPQVTQNDFAPQPQPFELTTRSTLERAANDPAIEKKTLSALESMMSSETPPAY